MNITTSNTTANSHSSPALSNYFSSWSRSYPLLQVFDNGYVPENTLYRMFNASNDDSLSEMLNVSHSAIKDMFANVSNIYVLNGFSDPSINFARISPNGKTLSELREPVFNVYGNSVIPSIWGQVIKTPNSKIVVLIDGVSKTIPSPSRKISNTPITTIQYIGKKNCSVLPEKNASEYLPNFITNELSTIDLELEETQDPDRAKIISNFNMTMIDFENSKIAIKITPRLHSPILKNFPFHASYGPETPIYIAHNDFYDLLKTVILSDNTKLYKFIEIKKIKKTFELVNITLDTYRSNPEKYIAILRLPKLVTCVTTDGGNCISESFCVFLPTLVIPASLRSPRLKSTELGNSLFEAIAEQNIKKLFANVLKQKKEKLQILCNYWDGALKVLGDMEVEKIQKEIVDPITFNYDLERKVLKPELTSILRVASSSPAVRTYSSSCSQYNKKLNVGYQLDDTKHKLERSIFSIEEFINNTLFKKQQEEQELETIKTRQKDLIDELELLKESITKSANEVTAELENAVNKASTVAVSSPIIVTRVRTPYRIISSLEIDKNTLKDSPYTRTITNLFTTEEEIIAISLETINPSRIYVDSATKPLEQCDVVVGGPYTVHLSKDQNRKVTGNIFLATPSSIFGIKTIDQNTVELKQHPHSSPTKINRGDAKAFLNFLNAPTKMCLGEIERDLLHYFENKDIENIKIAAYRWITSAWSADAWGSQWNYFPHPSTVDL